MKYRTLLLLLFIALMIPFVSNAQASNWQWAKSAGSNDADEALSVSVDAYSNTYVAGSFSGPSIIFGNDTLFNTNTGYPDAFLAKYDQFGNVLWARSGTGQNSDVVFCTSVDPSGNVLVAGGFYSPTITFGTTTLNNLGWGTIFLVKYDAMGNLLWARNAGANGSLCIPNSVATDKLGNCYITGTFDYSSITLGSITLINTTPFSGSLDLFLAKYDSNGNVLWAKNPSGTLNETGRSVSTDTLNNIYLSGDFKSPKLIFGTDTLLNSDAAGNFSDIFVAKYDSSGNVLWLRNTGDPNSDEIVQSGATTTAGQTFCTGTFNASFTFGQSTLTNNGNTEMYVLKYDASGNPLWAKNAIGLTLDYGCAMAVDLWGNCYVTGFFTGPTIDFGTSSLINTDPNNNTADLFLVAYDSLGNNLWAKGMEGISNDYSQGIAVDYLQNIYVTGTFNSPTAIFDTDTLTKIGTSSDIFLAKIGKGISPSSIEEMTQTDVSVYPNPSTGIFTVSRNSSDDVNIEVIDMLGNEIYSIEKNNDSVLQIDLSNQADGVYFLRVMSDGGISIVKIIKQ